MSVRTISQDSFSVAPNLLGLPLASPARRAAAMAIDLIVVSILIKLTGAALLGFAAAFVFWRIGNKGVFRWLFRLAAIGTVVLTVALWGWSRGGNDDERNSRDGNSGRELARADDDADDSAPNARPANLEDLPGLAAALDRATAAQDSVARDTLQQAIRGIVAGAELARLESRVRRQSRRIDSLNAELERTRTSRGARAMVSTVLDDMGLGFGWMALYFTAFLVLMRGQTIGKRVVGVRVVRLDARPITWFIAFERFGGYAASLTLGLLGFLQILWDRNRQGLHDKAVETVVVRELPAGAPR